VIAGPGDAGDETAAVPADRGLLRASHADRERVIDALKIAFVQGRLTKDEFDARVSQAFSSRTYAELAAVTDDIPAGVIGAQLPSPAARTLAAPQENARIKASVRVTAAATVLLAGGWMAAWIAQAGNPEIVVWLIALTVALSGAWLVTGSVLLLEARQQKHGRLPPRSTPGRGGRGSQDPASAAPARPRPPIDRGQRQIAEAGPRRRPARCCPPHGYRVHDAPACA
jgi:DUF1707 SHOCT-like domain